MTLDLFLGGGMALLCCLALLADHLWHRNA